MNVVRTSLGYIRRLFNVFLLAGAECVNILEGQLLQKSVTLASVAPLAVIVEQTKTSLMI